MPVNLWEAVGYRKIRDTIEAALNPPGPNGERTWRYEIQDVYPGYAIARDYQTGEFYRVDYTVNDRDEVEVGARTRVKVEYVPLTESLRLSEATQTDDAGRVFRVTLIRPGWSANGLYYGKDVLAAAATLYEGVKAYADHPTKQELKDRPERSIRDVVGWYENVRQEPDGRLTADLHLFETAAWLGSILKTKPDLLGLSHHALGQSRIGEAEGRTGRVVEAIAKVVSVDVVTEPAAGGSIDRLIASNRQEAPETREEDDAVDLKSLTIEQLRESRPDLVKAIEDAARQAARSEAEPALSQLRESVQAVSAENRTLRESLARFEAKAIIAEKVGNSNLPAPAKIRVQSMVEAAIPMKDGALDREALETKIQEAIKAEQDYLTKVAGSVVKGAGDAGAGSGGTGVLEEALKAVDEAFDRAFGIKHEEAKQ